MCVCESQREQQNQCDDQLAQQVCVCVRKREREQQNQSGDQLAQQVCVVGIWGVLKKLSLSMSHCLSVF